MKWLTERAARLRAAGLRLGEAAATAALVTVALQLGVPPECQSVVVELLLAGVKP